MNTFCKKVETYYHPRYTTKIKSFFKKMLTDAAINKTRKELDKYKQMKTLNTKQQLKKNELIHTLEKQTAFMKNQAIIQKNAYTKKANKEMKKMQKTACKKTYCNPNCKGTILEPGTIGLPESLLKEIEERFIARSKTTKLFTKEKIETIKQNSIKALQNEREQLFKNNSTVLENDFLKKLDPKFVAFLKKEGAISGCIRANVEPSEKEFFEVK